jgi:PAS domain S-box-containing protein
MSSHFRQEVPPSGPFTAEFRIISQAGEERWIEHICQPVYGAEKRWLGQRASNRDITDRKRAEEALRQSEQRLSLHFQQTPLAVIEWDVEGRVTKWNPGAMRVFGFTEEEALGRHVSFIVPPHIREHVEHLRDALLAHTDGGRSTKENVTKNGRTILCEWYNTPLIDAGGQVIGAASLAEDITERKQTEKQLQESEARYRTLAESTTDIIYILDESGTLRYANQTAAAYIGISPASLVGKTQQDLFPPELAERHVEHIRNVIETGEAEEMEALYRFGPHEAWLNVRTIPLRDEHGQITSLLGLCRDITERKRAEEALQNAHDELERRVEERTAELRTANEELTLFHRFAEASYQGFGMANMDGVFTYMNPAACRIVGGGAKPEDVLGKHLTTFYPKEYMLRREAEIFPALLQEGHWEGEVVLSSAGKTRHVLQNSFLIEDENGNPSHIASVTTDITDRKRIEEALRASEERYRSLFNSMTEGFSLHEIVTDENGHPCDYRYLDVNPAFERMTGRKRSDVIGQLKRQVTPGEDEFWIQTYSNVALGGPPVHFEHCAPNSQRHWQVYAYSPAPRQFAVLFTDITERKRAEEALRQNERRFRNYFEQGLVGMAVTSVDKRWLEVNDRLCEIMGYSREELLRSNWVELTHPEDLEPNIQLFNRLLAGEIEHFTLDKRFLRKDRCIVYTTIHIRAFRKDDGTIDHIVALFEDITARKQAEEALRASEERYELAVRGAGVGIWDYDMRTGKLYYSPRWKAMFGFEENEVGDSLDDWARLLHPDERDWILKVQEDFLAGTSPTVTVEYRLRHKDGSYRWIVAHGLVVRNEEGKAIRLVGSHGDITDRKRAEEALERERQSLWRMLQASDHERQTISYDIHDGLAQYLAAANMQFQVFDGLRENNPEAAKKAYDAATQLVSQSHAEARRLVSEVRPPIIDEIGLETAISHLVHEHRRHGGPNIDCYSDVQFGRLPAILENALYRIVQEALANACKHSKSKKVTVTLTQEGQDVRLEVRDWGTGFDPGPVEKGHFGLEGIRQRVRLLGGRLKIESTPGSGTLVQVVVPVVERQSEE